MPESLRPAKSKKATINWVCLSQRPAVYRKERKISKRGARLRFASLIYAMRKIEQEVLNILKDDCYMTRKVIMKRTGRCKTSVYDAVSSLLDADLIDEIPRGYA